jgi:endonuclease/exonuclease/phosphatase family metal-dependent hydrolase
MQILTWNLFHGRARPGAGRDLLGEFAAAIAGWEWDVALLQEVPPWWPRPLAERAGASMRMALTSRNELLPVRRALAVRLPNVVRSGGGGANAILVRDHAIADHRRRLLRRLPERRVLHAVRLAGDDGPWVANVHAEQQPRERPDRDVARCVEALDGWARERAVVFGGDLNVADPHVPGFARVAGHGVDHVYVRGLPAHGGRVLDAGRLSDHRPVLARVGRPG